MRDFADKFFLAIADAGELFFDDIRFSICQRDTITQAEHLHDTQQAAIDARGLGRLEARDIFIKNMLVVFELHNEILKFYKSPAGMTDRAGKMQHTRPQGVRILNIDPAGICAKVKRQDAIHGLSRFLAGFTFTRFAAFFFAVAGLVFTGFSFWVFFQQVKDVLIAERVFQLGMALLEVLAAR